MDRMDFPRSDEYFFEMLSCSVDQTSLDGRYNDGEGVLCPDAFFHHMMKYDVDDACCTCNGLLKMSFDCLLRSGWKPPDKMYVAIDFNNVETWAVKDAYVHKRLGKKETGSSRVHRYASIALVIKGFRYTLAVMPVKNTDPSWDVVRQLLLLAGRVVRVDCVLLDREFYDSDVYQMIMEMGLKYIGHVRKSKTLNRVYFQSLLEGERTASYKINYANPKRMEIEVYFKEREEDDDYDYMVVTSNKMVSPFEIDLLFEAYEARWNIENTYCEAKQFKARTNTTQHAYRLILYTLSHLLANLLMIMRIQVKGFTRMNMKKMVRLLLMGVRGPVRISIRIIIDFR
jgi:Transposase DDE domain